MKNTFQFIRFLLSGLVLKLYGLLLLFTQLCIFTYTNPSLYLIYWPWNNHLLQ